MRAEPFLVGGAEMVAGADFDFDEVEVFVIGGYEVNFTKGCAEVLGDEAMLEFFLVDFSGN